MHLQVCDILSSLFFIFFLILVVTTFLKNNQPSVCFLLLRCDSGFGLCFGLPRHWFDNHSNHFPNH